MAQSNVNCNSCGALLDIAPSVKFVTCGYCGTPLSVHRTGNSVYTEPSQSSQITTGAHTPQPAHSSHDRQTELNRLENQLNRLDIDWDREKENYMVTGKHGHRSVPSKFGSLFMCVVMAGFGIFWTSMASGMGAPGFFPMFGVLFICVAIGMGIYSFTKASDYEAAHEKYQRERQRLKEQIRQLGG